MGCCGCDNRTSTTAAGIFGIIQCLVGIILASYNLNIFKDSCFDNTFDKAYLCFVLFSKIGAIKALLAIVLILYLVWLISSILLLVGNSSNKVGFLRQWVILAIILIICDIILPSILLGVTFSSIAEQFTYHHDSTRSNASIISYASDRNLIQNYLVLVLAFSRGGLITWIGNIAFSVHVSRRATEIANPPATFVTAQAYPVPVQGYANPMQQPQYGQQGFIPQPQPTFFPEEHFRQQQYQQQPPQGHMNYNSPPPSYGNAVPKQ